MSQPPGPSLPSVSHMSEEYRFNLNLENRHLNDRVTFSQLASGITWVHIDDPEANSCSFVISVKVGSYDESLHAGQWREGLAHFLEHAIVFPITVEQKRLFIGINAFTTAQETQFFGETTSESFLQALEVSGNLFFEFSPSDTVRDEISAVHNE